MAARVTWGAYPCASTPPYIGEGLWGAPQSHLGPAKGGNLPPKVPHLGLGLPPLALAAWALGTRCGQPMWVAAPPLGPYGPFQDRGSQGGALRNLLEPSRNFPVPCRKIPELFRNLENHFPYMKLYLRTLLGLLVMSRISSETPNQYSFTPSNISSPSYIEALRDRKSVV